jgi:hypothetical protein
MPGVKVPADVELEDRLAFGLTGKQLLILAGSAVCAYGVDLLLSPLLPKPIALAATILAAAGGILLALARHDGMAGDQLALAVVRFLLAPRKRVLAPEGLPAPLPDAPPGARLAPLELPLRRILRSGLVELADGSHCRLLTAQGTSFELRASDEQAAFVAAFARFLNGLQQPVQILVRSELVTLEAQAEALERQASRLGGGLQAAASDHARYLRSLGAGPAPLRRRQIVLVLRSHERAELAEVALARNASQAVELLAGAEIELSLLDGEQTAALLARSLDPPGPPAGSRLEGVIHARTA